MRRLAGVLVLTLLVSACKVKVEQGFELRSDGSGVASVVIGFDEELQDLLASAVPPGQDPLSEMATDAPPGWRTDDWSEGEFRGFQATAGFSDLAELQWLVETEMSGDEGLFQAFSIERVGDGYRFDAVLSGESLEGSLEGLEGFDLSATADQLSATFFDAEIAVKLPGEVQSHNADDLRSDGTLVWRVNLVDGGRVIRAESQPGGGPAVLPLAAGGLGVAVVLMGFLVWRRRRPAHWMGSLAGADVPEPALVAVEGDPFAQ